MSGYNGYKIGGHKWLALEALLDGPKKHATLKAMGLKNTDTALSKAVQEGLAVVVGTDKNHKGQSVFVYDLTDKGRELLASADKEKDSGTYSLRDHIRFGSVMYRALSQLCAVYVTAHSILSTKDLIEEEIHEIRKALINAGKRGWVDTDKSEKPHKYKITPAGEDALNKAWELAHGN